MTTTKDCLTPCTRCGLPMKRHSRVTKKCEAGCICSDKPGHKKDDCDRLCRFCVLEDRNSNRKIPDCKRHCPLHVTVVDAGPVDHRCCVQNHKACPSCKERHWHQDCPHRLSTMCLLGGCRGSHCVSHCKVCGGFIRIDELKKACPNGFDQPSWDNNIRILMHHWHH
jgi:hypothetical protein